MEQPLRQHLEHHENLVKSTTTQTDIIVSGSAAFKWRVDPLNPTHSRGNGLFTSPFKIFIGFKSSYQNLCRNAQFIKDTDSSGPSPSCAPVCKTALRGRPAHANLQHPLACSLILPSQEGRLNITNRLSVIVACVC